MVLDDAAKSAAAGSLDPGELRSLLDHSPDIIARYDRQLRALYVSRGVEAITGHPPEHFVGRTGAETGMPGRLCAWWEAALERVLLTGEPGSVEFELPTLRGPRWLASRIAPERGPDGAVRTVVVLSRDVTEAMLAKRRLEWRERHLQTVLDSLPECVLVVAPDGTVADANAAGLVMLEAEALERVRGLPLRSLVPDSAGDEIQALFQSALCGGAPTLEAELLGLRGGRRWIALRAVPLRGGSSQVVGVLAMGQDITDRRRNAANLDRALEALRESEERFRGAFEHAAVGKVVADSGGSFVRVNRAFAAMLGYEPHELVGRTFAEVTHPDDRERDLVAARALRQGADDSYAIEKRYVSRDGRAVWARVNLVAVRDAAGDFRYAIAEAIDVTLERQAEAALRASERVLRTMFENMPIVFSGIDEQGVIRIWNREAERVTGYSREEVVGNPHAWTLLFPDPDYRAWVLAQAALSAGEFRDRELTITRRDGTRRTLSWSSQSKRTPLPEVASWAVAVDVTDRIALEAQFRQAQKMEAVGQLAGGIAHDFNNLLTAILNNAELAMAALPESLAARAEIEEITRAALRAGELTRKLLTFSRRQVLQVRALDLNALVLGCQPLLRRLLDERALLETALDPLLQAVQADPGQLELVLVNLVVNARDAMADGGTVTVETAPLVVPHDGRPGIHDLPPGEYVSLTVRDTGIGMDLETQAHVFEPFFTTKPVGQGTGLGLAMVYGVVTQCGGTIRVDSVPGRGSAFQLIFPRSVEAVAPLAPARPATPRGQETILLVEDETAVRASARRVLEHHGYSVIEARHGADALLVWRERRAEIDLVLSDVRMPEMGGPELAARLRAEAPGLPVLFMSGYATREARGSSQLGPEETVLEKPFEIETLLEGIRGVLDSAPGQPSTRARNHRDR
ncbi:MAG TPA: PAS domain S-box protein [Gemmatimonadales bacterium]|nr:PAS domain S-box protein [Gemmatimonadales bacterium]